MKIKTLALNNTTGAITLGDQAFVMDSPTKATVIFDVAFGSAALVSPVVETVEMASERVTGGTLRTLAKATFRIPCPLIDAMGSVKFGAVEVLPIHVVMAIPKALQQSLTNVSTNEMNIRKGLAYLIAKGLRDCAAMMEGDAAQSPAPTDWSTNTASIFAAAAPLKRAVAGLQPLDVASGLYAGAV